MKYSAFIVLVFACLVISNSSRAEARQCGNFSIPELNNLSLVIFTGGHKYKITSKEFLDGWRKLVILAYDSDGFDELDKFKDLVSMPIHQCLCGSLASDSYLYTSSNKEMIFRFQCLDIPLQFRYRVKIISHVDLAK